MGHFKILCWELWPGIFKAWQLRWPAPYRELIYFHTGISFNFKHKDTKAQRHKEIQKKLSLCLCVFVSLCLIKFFTAQNMLFRRRGEGIEENLMAVNLDTLNL